MISPANPPLSDPPQTHDRRLRYLPSELPRAHRDCRCSARIVPAGLRPGARRCGIAKRKRTRNCPPLDPHPASLAPDPYSFINPAIRLDPGETQAISLAEELHADHLLIDEWAGRAAAQSRGLHVIGTLGVLDQAAERNLIDLKATFEKLTQTTFRVDQILLDQLLARHQERHRTK